MVPSALRAPSCGHGRKKKHPLAKNAENMLADDVAAWRQWMSKHSKGCGAVSEGREDSVTHVAGRAVTKGIVGNCLC